MLPTELLNARSITYGELIGNGRSYRVPPFQRDYSWKKEFWEELWEDVIRLVEGKPESEKARGHYLGTIVLQELSETEYVVIDGQQRLATLSLLALAAVKRHRSLAEQGIDSDQNKKWAETFYSDFLGFLDRIQLVEKAKLELNRRDDNFYRHYLLRFKEHPNIQSQPRSNRLLNDALRFFEEKIEENTLLSENGAALARFLDETLGRRVLFIRIGVQDELSAYTIFETLNARGMKLSASDLLRNYLFSILTDSYQQEFLSDAWDRFSETVGQDNLTEFLRFYLMLTHTTVRGERLFKLFKDNIGTAEQVTAFLEDIESYAELYLALGSPSHEFWRENQEQKKWIRELVLFEVKQLYPVLFAAHRRFSPADFTRLLKLLTVVSFRYTIIGGLNPNALESAYGRVAREIMAGTIKRPRGVFESLLRDNIYVPDEKFKDDFSYVSIPVQGRKRHIVKYILARIEDFVRQSPGSSPEVSIDFETDKGTIEHILPQKPNNLWVTNFKTLEHGRFVHRLGNYALLESSGNQDVGGQSFKEKKQIFAKSGYQLTQELAAVYEDWKPDQIEHRQRKLAEYAVQIWRADFDEG